MFEKAVQYELVLLRCSVILVHQGYSFFLTASTWSPMVNQTDILTVLNIPLTHQDHQKENRENV
jgi:hypothetical protein